VFVLMSRPLEADDPVQATRLRFAPGSAGAVLRGGVLEPESRRISGNCAG